MIDELDIVSGKGPALELALKVNECIRALNNLELVISHNIAKPKCPKCDSSFSWKHGVLLKCGECGHEWKRAHRL